MGSRGASSGIKKNSVFGNEKPLHIETEYFENGRYFKESAFEAIDLGDGRVMLGYAQAENWHKYSRTNRISQVEFNLKHGFAQDKRGRVTPHNLNLDNIKSFEGTTYQVKDYLKEHGYKWRNKRWEKD